MYAVTLGTSSIPQCPRGHSFSCPELVSGSIDQLLHYYFYLCQLITLASARELLGVSWQLLELSC